MKSILRASLVFLLLSAFSWAAQDVVSAVHGTVTKVDSATKTIVVKTKDGTEHTIKFVDKTIVHGVKASADATAAGSKDTFHGMKEGTEVVAHYTEKGTEKTAVEVDNVGKDGIKSVDGTIMHIDRGWQDRGRKNRRRHRGDIQAVRSRRRRCRQRHRKGNRKNHESHRLLHRRSRQENRPLLRETLTLAWHCSCWDGRPRPSKPSEARQMPVVIATLRRILLQFVILTLSASEREGPALCRVTSAL